jgi:hypothetical protein
MSDNLIQGVFRHLTIPLAGFNFALLEGLVRLENMAWQCDGIYYFVLFGRKTLEGVFLWYIMSEHVGTQQMQFLERIHTGEEFKNGLFLYIRSRLLRIYIYIYAYAVGGEDV